MMMNECLLVKWIWKIAQGSEGLWYKTIKTKYMHGDSFWRSKRKGVSQFWKGLHKIKHLFKWRAINKVNNGEGSFFWTDVWKGRCR
jgi:hypothetical protein